MTDWSTSRGRLHLVCLALLVAALSVAAFWPSVRFGFLNWDDDRNFLQNESFLKPGWVQWKWAWTTYHLGVWQPLAWLLFSAEYAARGLEPQTFHLSSILLHALVCAALFLISVQILSRAGDANKSGAYAASFMTSILFAIHPLRVEPVAWISSQPYMPAAFFYLCATAAYLRKVEASSPPHRHLWLAVCCALYCCAVLFKAAAVSLPIVLIILDYYLYKTRANESTLRQQSLSLIVEKIPFFIVATAVSVFAAHAKDYNESRIPISLSGLDGRIAQASYGLFAYLYKTIVPLRLTPYDRLPSDISLARPLYAATFVAAIGITAILFKRRQIWPGPWAAWLAYVVILLPNLGLMQISQQRTAERYSYIAIMPVIVLLAGAIQRIKPAKAALVLPLAAAICLGLMRATRAYLDDWKDSKSLWSWALATDPNCAVAACNLGAAYLEDANYNEAATMLKKAIALDPTFSFAHSDLGVVYLAQGDPSAAIVALEKALQSDPPMAQADLARTHASLGAAYAGLRKDDLAWKHTLKARDMGFTQSEKMIRYLSQFSNPPSSQP